MLTEEEKKRIGVVEQAPWELRTLLLVEPEAAIREPLQAGLSEAGYEVISLPTGEAALSAVQERRGQLLILDKHCVTPHWLEVIALVHADPWGAKNVPVCVFIDPEPDRERDMLLAWHAGVTICLTRAPKVKELLHFIKQLPTVWP